MIENYKFRNEAHDGRGVGMIICILSVLLSLYVTVDLTTGMSTPTGVRERDFIAMRQEWDAHGVSPHPFTKVMTVRSPVSYTTPPAKSKSSSSTTVPALLTSESQVQQLQQQLEQWRKRALVAEGKYDDTIVTPPSALPPFDTNTVLCMDIEQGPPKKPKVRVNNVTDSLTPELSVKSHRKGKCVRSPPTIQTCRWLASDPCCQSVCDGGPSSTSPFIAGEIIEYGYSLDHVFRIRSFWYHAKSSERRAWMKNRIGFKDSPGRGSGQQRVFYLEKARELGSKISVYPRMGSTRIICSVFMHWVTGASKQFVYQYFTQSMEMMVDLDGPKYRKRAKRNRVIEWLKDYGSYYQVRVCMYVCMYVYVYVCIF